MGRCRRGLDILQPFMLRLLAASTREVRILIPTPGASHSSQHLFYESGNLFLIRRVWRVSPSVHVWLEQPCHERVKWPAPRQDHRTFHEVF